MSTSKIVAGAVGAVLLIALLIGGVHVLRSRPGMGDLQPRTQAAVSKYSLGQVAPLPANAVNPNRWIMNSQGDAVGFANIGTRTLFYYHDGSVSQIPVPPGFDWLAIARITDDGTISCSAEVGQPGHLSQLAVLTGTKDGLSVSASLPTANTYNEIVNEHGAAFCFGKTGPGQFTLFRVAGGQESPIKTFNGQRAVLTAIDSKGDVVGGFRSRQGGWKPFIYSGGNLTLPPMPAGAAVSMPAAISDSGYVVGSSNQTSQGPQTAWLYRDGSVESLGALPGYQGSGANAINNAGVAVGAVYKGGDGGPPTGSVAALFENNHATDLNTLIDPGSGIVLQNADSINDRGQILCDGQQGDKLVMVLLTPAK